MIRSTHADVRGIRAVFASPGLAMSQPLMTSLLAFAMTTALWPVSIWLKDVSIIDILWAPAFAVVAAACALLAPALDARAWIALALVWVWATRFGSHVFRRWRRHGHEDYRYAAIRKARGPNFPFTSLFWIFWLQALLLWIISWPLQAAFSFQRPLTALDGLGIALVVAGIAIEGIADAQLTRFRADPQSAGRVLDTGLWSVVAPSQLFRRFHDVVGLLPDWSRRRRAVVDRSRPDRHERAAHPLFRRGPDGRHDRRAQAGLCGLCPPHEFFVPWPPSRAKQTPPSH